MADDRKFSNMVPNVPLINRSPAPIPSVMEAAIRFVAFQQVNHGTFNTYIRMDKIDMIEFFGEYAVIYTSKFHIQVQYPLPGELQTFRSNK